jgi:MFS family permease
VTAPAPKRARLGPSFFKLWSAGTVSSLGTGLASVATPLFVAHRTSNAFVIALAFFASTVPWLLFALPAGVVADRVDRRLLMIWVDVIRLGVLAVLGAAIVTGHVSLALLYTVLFLDSLGEILLRSAWSAMITAIVPRDQLERANGWIMGGTTLTRDMLAGPLGALLFTVAASLPFLANAMSYAASALFVALIPGTFRAQPKAEPGAVRAPRRSIRSDVASGLRWLMGQKLLRTMALLIGLLNVTLTAALSVLVLVARDRLHVGSLGYGALFTCMAVGGLIGSVIGDRLIKLVTATWTIRIGLIIEAVLHLILATSTSAITVGGAFLIFGVHGALWTIAASSLRQRLTPDEVMGRVSSAYLFVGAGGNCIGALLGGALASAYGLTAPYWVGFGVAVLVSAVTWRTFNRQAVAEAYASPAPTAEPAPQNAEKQSA